MLKKEIIGLMSGTSLDGLDIAHVEFIEKENKYTYNLKNTRNISYPKDLFNELQNIDTRPLSELQILDKKIGFFFGNKVNEFIEDFKLNKDDICAIASHGQTILHQPQNGFTLQIGCGSTIAYQTGIEVINDFRTLDVIAGGQGAPLVPVGDFDLFESKADSFLNIGGFCNISFKNKDVITAFDICPGNLPLNRFAGVLGFEYDHDGDLAKSGKVLSDLLSHLNSIEYYHKSFPKSLGVEWLNSIFYPKITSEESPENLLHTLSLHIAEQIINCLHQFELKSVYITGGGAKNTYLIDLIRRDYHGKVIIPDTTTIDFKEAIVFAYLGFKYLLNQSNNLPSVTGAERKLCTGVLHRPGY